MVKGVSRQVIVVHRPDPKLFDQAIFILKDDVVGQGITEEALIKEAQQVVRTSVKAKQPWFVGPIWAAAGAAAMAVVWLMTVIL